MNPEDVAQSLLAERVALTGYLRAFVRERAAAEDLFQDVTVRAVAAADSFSGPTHLRRWFRKVARHRAIDFLRRAENRMRVFDADVLDLLARDDGERANDFSDGQSERAAALESCMGGLTPKSREVIALRYGEDLSGQQVAERLGRKVDTVYKMLARSYSQLRECIEAKLAAGRRGELR